MVEWKQVQRDLAEAGYPDFEFDTGKTAVPGLSGSWVVGKIPREEWAIRENRPFPWNFLDALPFLSAIPTDPECAPESISQVAEKHELDIVAISVGRDWVRIALCDPA